VCDELTIFNEMNPKKRRKEEEEEKALE